MKTQKQLAILQKILGSFQRVGEEFLFYCPFCGHHKQKFSIRLNKKSGVFKCWIPNCKKSGNVLYLIRRFGNKEQLLQYKHILGIADYKNLDSLFDEEVENKELVKLPEEFESLLNGYSLRSLRARNYLRSRNISEDIIVDYRMGYCSSGKYENRVIIPSFDQNGYVNYFVARTYNGSTAKYLNPKVSNNVIFNELNVEWDEPIILVEGVFDAINIGGNSIPLLGSMLKEDSLLFQRIVESGQDVFIALDHNAESMQEKIAKMFIEYGVNAYTIDTGGYEDVGSMPLEIFKKRTAQAHFMDQESYLLRKILSLKGEI